ncbi:MULTISPECIES: response regulator transcription factor [unclassified Sphingomonas]|uniref:response regulator transcription factor n=1 Tax=Sphingomonas TaxID=13687 RepID=UPI00095DF106|nr:MULTISPECIES: response regulator [unclassified Sphingomonas]MBN8812113.1 response regulator transcription factor [Sphingomonas sp.]OJY48249.1 MAG: DNA-binding response regulator [Sphingomonas sp. 67-41]
MDGQRLVHIVDDEDSVRNSIGFMLRTTGYAVRLWPSGAAFLRELRSVEPGCVLLDIRMPEIDGLQVQQLLNERGAAMPVIVLTGHGDVAVAVKAMRAGAVDFLEKPFEADRLLNAIDKAFERMRESNGASRTDAARTQLANLSAREREVLEGLAAGFPNKTIAYDLGISPRTVEVHRANLMQKLGARSLSEALRVTFTAEMGEIQRP